MRTSWRGGAELVGAGDALYGVSVTLTLVQSVFKEKPGVGSEQLSDSEPKGAAGPRPLGVRPPGGLPSGALVAHRRDGADGVCPPVALQAETLSW